MVESRPTRPGEVPRARQPQRCAHISGRTGNITVGGRADNVNTGISLKSFVSENPEESDYPRVILADSRCERAFGIFMLNSTRITLTYGQTSESPYIASISRETGSVDVGFDASDINTGVVIW